MGQKVLGYSAMKLYMVWRCDSQIKTAVDILESTPAILEYEV